MNRWKEELKQAFAAPPPLQKQKFIRQLQQPSMCIQEFLFSQLGYIRKWIWCVSVLIFSIAVLGTAIFSLDMVWGISALTPLLALTLISESGRSESYGMAELEMATRFSLRSVILARLLILGLLNLILLCLLIFLGFWNNELSPFAVGLYIITPFLLTAFAGLCIVRKFRGREAGYTCVGIAACISCFVFLSHYITPYLYQEDCLRWWITAAVVLCMGIGKQCIFMIKRTEEAVWSLS